MTNTPIITLLKRTWMLCCAILKHFMDHGITISFVEGAAAGSGGVAESWSGGGMENGKWQMENGAAAHWPVAMRWSVGLRDTWECGSAQEVRAGRAVVPPVRRDVGPRVVFHTEETAQEDGPIFVIPMPIIEELVEEPLVILVQK